jgi:hypothetical protein
MVKYAAPNSHYRVLVTPAGRRKGKKAATPEQSKTPAQHRVAMTWAKRLKRVFNISHRPGATWQHNSDARKHQACG